MEMERVKYSYSCADSRLQVMTNRVYLTCRYSPSQATDEVRKKEHAPSEAKNRSPKPDDVLNQSVCQKDER